MGRGAKGKSFKGCAMCKPQKWTAAPPKEKKPWAELRALGKKRRVGRHELGD